jgi:general secretion pathway protein J
MIHRSRRTNARGLRVTRFGPRSSERGLTLLEVLIAVAVLTLVSIMIYGAFSTINRGKQNAGQLADRYRLARLAMTRMSRELSSAYVSAHVAATPALITRITAFIGTSKRVDFDAFAHRRILKDSHESDQCELSYFVATDPKNSQQYDLARREQIIIDDLPGKGGASTILVDDVDSFSLRYLDPLTGLWTDSWDTTSTAAQFGRMPLQVEIKLVMKGGPAGEPIRLSTKTPIQMLQPLAFALK